jgi:DNA-binding MarR family transcriptional regulator
MKSIEIDKELEHLKKVRNRSWAKLVSRLKKQLDYKIDSIIREKGHADFKLGFMPFLMNIDREGITNNDLSKRFAVTKQATSKIISELADRKYVTTQPHGADGRSSIVHLTDKGKRLVVESKHCMERLTDEYKALIGKKEYEHLIDMLEKIANYNDEKGITPYM